MGSAESKASPAAQRKIMSTTMLNTISKVWTCALVTLFLLSQGSCTAPPATPHTYHRPRTEVQKMEDRIADLMSGPKIVRRSHDHLLDHAMVPVPKAVFDQAKHAREAVLSD